MLNVGTINIIITQQRQHLTLTINRLILNTIFFFYLFVKFEFLHVQEFKKIVINGLLIEIYPLNHSTYYLPITPPKRSLKISYLL